MSLDPTSPSDSAPFPTGDVPIVSASFHQAIEAAVADQKRRLDMMLNEFAEQSAPDPPDDPKTGTETETAAAAAVTHTSNKTDEPSDTQVSDASSTMDPTEPTANEPAGEKTTDDSDTVDDGDSPDDRDPPAKSLHPYWIPPGLDLSDWSPELLADVAALINPLYDELVLAAPSPLARSVGCTIVYLHWLEIIDQLEIGFSSLTNDFARLQRAVDGDPRPAIIERYLRVVGAKLRFSQFLLHLEKIKTRHECSPSRPAYDSSDQPYRSESSYVEPSSADFPTTKTRDPTSRPSRPMSELAEELHRRHGTK